MRFIFIFTLLVLPNLNGCVSLPRPPGGVPSHITSTATGSEGLYHNVQKGETLWRISKKYGINLDELAQINHIGEDAAIEIGQQIFIPKKLKRPEIKNFAASDNSDFTWPIKGRVILGFKQTSNTMVNEGLHIQPTHGNDVVAAKNGKVVFLSPNLKGFGKTIFIDHGDGFLSVYAQNSEVYAKLGNFVQKGEIIGKVDSYLHFEIRKGYVAQNPKFYLP